MAMMWGRDWSWGWGDWLAMSLLMVVFWGLIIAGIVALVRYLGGDRPSARRDVGDRPPNAEELLAERFARGEIDADEYTRRRELLRADR